MIFQYLQLIYSIFTVFNVGLIYTGGETPC
jgi:hypothetical protein